MLATGCAIYIIRQKRTRKQEKKSSSSAHTSFRGARFINALCNCTPHIGDLVRRGMRRRRRQRQCRPRVRVLYSYVPGWRAYSSARRGSKPSRADARLYRVDGGCCKEASQICFSTARIYSNLQRLGTSGFRKKKRGPQATLFLLSFPFSFCRKRERELASLARFTHRSTEQYRVTREGGDSTASL